MIKKFGLLALLITLIISVPVMAQDDVVEEEPPDCPSFEGSSVDVRVGYYMGEGEAFRLSGQTQRAIDSFTCIIAVVDDDYIPAYINRASLFAQRRLYEESIEDYTTIIDLDSRSVPAFNNRAIINAVIGEYELAMDDFNQVISIDSNFVTGYNNRAVLYTLVEDYDSALADLEQALEISGIADILALIQDPERDTDIELPEFTNEEAQTYALFGIIYSAQALDNYQSYLTLVGQNSDQRIQSAAGALESRFTFELRLDDGSWLMVASFAPEAE